MDCGLHEVSTLVRRLNSSSQTEAKEAAAKLDGLLYPARSAYPKIITHQFWNSVSEEHFRKLRASESLLPLIETLDRGNDFAREYAASRLGQIGDERAIPLLLSALSDTSPIVRRAAASNCTFLRNLLFEEPLIKLLDDEHEEVVCAAAHSLGMIKSRNAIVPLSELASHRDWRRRQAAIFALGLARHLDALSVCRAALRDKHRQVRKSAQFALSVLDGVRRRGK